MVAAIKLQLWVMPNAGFETRRLLQRELLPFKKQHPQIDVEIKVHPWHFAWDRLIAVSKQKTPLDCPDVIQIGGTWNTTLAALGLLTDLTSLLDQVDRNDVIRPTWNYCYEPSRTKAYSMPWFMDVRVLYYRKDILKTIQVEPETLTSWQGFRLALEKVAKHPKLSKKLYPMPLPGQKEGLLIHDLAPWVWGSGGGFLSSDRQHAQFHEPLALQGIHFYLDMIASGLVPLMGRDRWSPGSFFSGNFAFQVSGAWPVTSYLNPKFPYYVPEVAENYGIAMFPTGPAGNVTFLGGSNLAIPKASRYPEAAWKLIQFLSQTDTQAKHAKEIGMLPTSYSALEVVLGNAPSAIGEVFRQSLRVARTLPCAATLGTLERILGRSSQLLLNDIRNKQYSEKKLQDEFVRAASESDYIFSLYE